MKRSTLRQFWVLVHRYAGLYMALFLVVAGATGSVLAFTPELFYWLNPEFQVAAQDRPMLDGLALHDLSLRAITSQGRIASISLHREKTDAYVAWVEPRTDASTGQPFSLPFNILLLNPYTGEEIDRINLTDSLWPITRQNFLTVVIALHFRLAVPGSLGLWAFGIAALLWTLDCFVGAYLTFPASPQRRSSGTDEVECSRSKSWWWRWTLAWRVKWRGSTQRIAFDLHRAGGLWVWLMLLVLAWSSVGLNLNREIYTPVMKAVFGMPDVNADPSTGTSTDADPILKWYQARAIGRQLVTEQSKKLGFKVLREESLQYYPDKGVFSYAVRSDRDINDRGGSTTVTFTDGSGKLRAVWLPSGWNAGATIHSWIFGLHQAFVWGLPYKIFLCLTGLAIVVLSLTGAYIWWKKHQARAFVVRRRSSVSPACRSQITS